MMRFADTLYCGTDLDFIRDLQSFCQRHGRPEPLIIPAFASGTFVSHATSGYLGQVFMDTTSHPGPLDELVEEVAFIKGYRPFRNILFTAMMAANEDDRTSSVLLASGFQYLFIKGCESETFFRDCQFLQSGEGTPPHDFAVAANIFQTIEVGVCSTLYSMGERNFRLESDVPTSDGTLQFQLSMFPDLPVSRFAAKLMSGHSSKYPMTYSYLVDYPYPTVWDEPSANSLMKDTVETWLGLNEAQLVPERLPLYVISPRFMLLKDLHLLRDQLSYELHVSDIFYTDETKSEFNVADAAMLFYDTDTANQDSMTDLAALCDHLRKSGQEPFLVVCNTKSTMSALQHVFEYSRLLATPAPLTAGLVMDLTKKLASKTSHASVSTRKSFNASSPIRPVDLVVPVLLTSISEHEVTFITPVEIPMFAVIRFDLAVNFYATLVPTYRPLTMRPGQYHYLGLIHGVKEETLNLLRQFINQIIHSPLSEYSTESIQKVMDGIHPKNKPLTPSLEVPSNSEPIVASMPSSRVTIDSPGIRPKRVIKGKSKL